MSVLHVSSKEFRARQASYFDQADNGTKIIIRRGRNNKSYALVPIEDEDLYLSDEVEKRIELSREQYRNGNVIICNTAEEAIKHLESL